MKKLLTLLVVISLTTITLNCSSDRNDDTTQQAQDFTNATYIKNTMVGKWKFTAHESSAGVWVNTTYDSYFVFKTDNTYEYKSVYDTSIIPLQTGTYAITPVSGNNNAYLTLTYTENNKTYTRKIILKSLEGNVVTIFEDTWNERYTKQ